MEITIKNENEVMYCQMNGRLDTLASQQAAKDIQPLLDHAELRLLLTLRKETARKGGKVIIRNIREEIRQIFLMTGFYNLFEIQ